MAFKVNFFHVVQGRKVGGFTQTFYNSLSNLDQVMSQAVLLAPKLNNLTNKNTFLTFIRATNLQDFRNFKLQEVNPPTGGGPFTPTGGDYVNTCIVIPMLANPNFVTRQFFRSLREDVVVNSGRYVPNALFVSGINATKTLLTGGSNGWCLRVLDPARPSINIQLIDPATGIVTAKTHGFLDQSKIRISGYRSLRAANRLWKISVLSPDTFSLQHWAPQTNIPVGPQFPIARGQLYIFPAMAGFGTIAGSSHKTGKPGFLLSGKSKTRR